MAMWTLGFKPKYLTFIFILLSATILLLRFIKVDVRDVLVSVTTSFPHWSGWNRDGSEIREILTTVHQDFGGCTHRCAGKLKHREQD